MTGACPLLVVIVNYKTAALTIACLETLRPELDALPGARVTVVENASGDAEALAHAIDARGWSNWVTLDVSEHNGGFAAGNNRGIRPALASDAPPRYVLLLNADTEVRPGAIRTLVAFMDGRPDVGIAGSSFENLDGSDWHIAFRFITPLNEIERGLRFGPVSRLMKRHVVHRVMEQDAPRPVDWVAGACMLIRREVIDAIGLMDEGYFLYFEEVDYCLRARRRGWPCWYVPESRVMHIAGQSSGLTERDRRPPRTPSYWFASRRRYFLKNYGLPGALAADLAFGLGFSLWRVRRALQRKPDPDPPRHLADFWRQSVLFRKNRRLDPPG
jgi:N-acetylglucosaminyl-diphospho-decaprenol L-rhamnosyltransferase